MSCKVITIDKDTTAIICGSKDHVCDDNGPGMIQLNTGEWIVQNGSIPCNAIAGSVSCSICGRLAIDDAPYLEI